MEKQPTTGDQVCQRVDITQVGTEFVQYFYEKWMTNPNELLQSGIFKDHTRLKTKGVVYQKADLIQMLITSQQAGISFTINDLQIMDSGGRRADILVIGKIKETTQSEEMNFSQYFTIAKNK